MYIRQIRPEGRNLQAFGPQEVLVVQKARYQAVWNKARLEKLFSKVYPVDNIIREIKMTTVAYGNRRSYASAKAAVARKPRYGATYVPRRSAYAPPPLPPPRRRKPVHQQKVVYSRQANRVMPAASSGSLGRTMLTGAGSALGGFFGPGGAAVGGALANGLSTVLGLGAYEIKQNVFMDGKLPKIVNDSPSGGTIIRHSEYLGDVITSSTPGAFSLAAYGLNPADETTNPWLAQIAANYEEYEYEGLLFQFRSTSADALNSTNTALGSVIMATNYDAADGNFTSKAEMLNYEFSCSTKPSDSCMHMIECAPSQTVLPHRYTRPGLALPGTDIRFYDLGKFQIATTGFQGTSVNIGELHCTYQVRLLKPKLFASLGNDINYFALSAATAPTAALPLGATQTIVYDNMGCTSTSTSITLPRSQVIETYWIRFFYSGTVAGVITHPAITGSNVTFSPTISPIAPQNGNTALALMQSVVFRTQGNGLIPVLNFGTAGVLPTGTTFSSVTIHQGTGEAPFP